MGGWLRQIALNAQLRAGLSGDIAIWGAVAAVAVPVAFVFFVVAAFVWLSHRYGAVIAGLVLGAAFLVVALVAIVACVFARQRNIERARLRSLRCAEARMQTCSIPSSWRSATKLARPSAGASCSRWQPWRWSRRALPESGSDGRKERARTIRMQICRLARRMSRRLGRACQNRNTFQTQTRKVVGSR